MVSLIQHNIVKVDYRNNVPYYTYSPQTARMLMRYPAWIEHVHNYLGELECQVYEAVLLSGRLTTVTLVNQILQASEGNPKANLDSSSIADATIRLEELGYLIRYPLSTSQSIGASGIAENGNDHLEQISRVLQKKYDGIQHTVWKINVGFSNAMLRAEYVGDFVQDLQPQIPWVKEVVTAGLRAGSHFQFVTSQRTKDRIFAAEDGTRFQIDEIVRFLSTEEKETMQQNREDTLETVRGSLQKLLRTRDPNVVYRASNDTFCVNLPQLFESMHERVRHKIVLDRQGERAARVVRILQLRGWLESDTLATLTMVPAMEARGILHNLYQNGYVELFPMSNSRHHNPSGAVYLWGVRKERLAAKIVHDVSRALFNMRLRHQHELDRGKGVSGRSNETGSDIDFRNSALFELGLERVQNALFELEKTLGILTDLVPSTSYIAEDTGK